MFGGEASPPPQLDFLVICSCPSAPHLANYTWSHVHITSGMLRDPGLCNPDHRYWYNYGPDSGLRDLELCHPDHRCQHIYHGLGVRDSGLYVTLGYGL